MHLSQAVCQLIGGRSQQGRVRLENGFVHRDAAHTQHFDHVRGEQSLLTEAAVASLQTMGAWHSKVGSAPFYASFERSLERLKTDAANLKVRWVSLRGPLPLPLSLRPPCLRFARCPPQLLDTFWRVQAQTAERQRRRAKISSTIVFYACAIFAALFVYALWVRPCPQGACPL